MKTNICNGKLTYRRLFVTISLTGTVLFILYAVIFGHISFPWMAMSNRANYYFMDYFRHVLFTADPSNLYSTATGEWGCFPPFIYIIYFLLYRMTAYWGLAPENWRELMQVDEAVTVFLYYSIFVAIIMFLAIQMWQKKGGSFKLFLCLSLSAPFFAGIERGNSIILVFTLLLVVLKWKDSESPARRELALILIAVCAAIKIYPAIFGLIYIKDKRYRETLRLVGYGVLFFFGPFLFFGGFKGFSLWLSNISSTLVVYSIGRVEYIRGLVVSISYLLTGGAWTADYLSLVLPNVYLIFMVALFFMSKNQYRSVFYLCAIMTFYPSNAFRYTLCYLAIPLVMFLMEHGDEQVVSKLVAMEMTGFGLLFTVPTLYGLFTNFNEKMFERNGHLTYVELRLYVVAYIILGIIIVHELIDIIKYKQINESLTRKI